MAKENGAKENGNGKPATTTAIGPTIIIKGKLRSDEDLIVRGRVEAEISSSKALLVENSGIIKANIKVKSARISGVLVGNVTAEERVEIAPDGRMVGDLTAPKIIINDGAAFRGRIDMQNFDEAQDGRPKSEPSAPAKMPATGGDQPSAAAAK
jgi:cytoskeletal protein CcmA (bactofilin family)